MSSRHDISRRRVCVTPVDWVLPPPRLLKSNVCFPGSRNVKAALTSGLVSEKAWRTVKAVCVHGCHNAIPYGTEFSTTHSQDSAADDEGSSGHFPTRNGLLS